MAKASLSYGGYFSCKLVSEHKHCQMVFSWEAFRAGPGTTNEQRLNCDWMCRVWLPQRTPPLPGLATAQEQGNPRAQISKEPQLLVHLCQPEDQSHRRCEWETLSEGWFFLQKKQKPTTHFIYYIICDCVQFADTLMMVSMYGVFGIWLTQDGMK